MARLIFVTAVVMTVLQTPSTFGQEHRITPSSTLIRAPRVPSRVIGTRSAITRRTPGAA